MLLKNLILIFVSIICLPIAAQKDVFDIARNGTLEDIKKINIASPGVINSKNADGYTPLILACYKGNVDVVKFLVKNSNTINIPSGMGTAMMAATYKGQAKIVKLLLENKANPNLTDQNGQNALMMAIIVKNKEIIELLLKSKIDLNARDNNKKQAIDYALMTNDQTIIKLITKN